MGTKQTTNVHLFPKQDTILRRVIEDGLFFAPWTGDVETALVKNADGTITRKIVSASKSIVERVDGFVGEGADTSEIPLSLPLEEEPLTGNAYFPGTGEKLRYKFRKAFINQIGKVVEKQNGLMDRIRTDKLEKAYKRAAPELIAYMKKWLNAEFVSAEFEGHSMNVTKGLNDSPDGIGATKVLHPNMFTNTVDPSTGGSLTAVGTEGYNKKVGDITTAIDTNYAGIKIPSPKYLDKVGQKLDTIGIQKRATYKGKKYWLAVINRGILSNLKLDDTFRKDIREVFMGTEYDNPLFSQDTWIFDEYLFVIDKKVSRSWNNDTLDFAGTGGYINPGTFASGKNHSMMVIMGDNSLGWSNVIPFQTRLQKDNFDLFQELLALTIIGVGRGEYVAPGTDESTYFAKGNNATTTLDSEIAVHNQSSAMFAVKTD